MRDLILWERTSRMQYRSDRQCKNGNGFWKVQYATVDEAWPNAVWLRQHRGKPYVPYRCGQCDLWHVGRSRMHPTAMYELGERAYWNLRWESERGTVHTLKRLFRKRLRAS